VAGDQNSPVSSENDYKNTICEGNNCKLVKKINKKTKKCAIRQKLAIDTSKKHQIVVLKYGQKQQMKKFFL